MEAWTATKEADSVWLFTWGGVSGEIFEVWLDGELLDTVDGDGYQSTVEGYDDIPPHLEIFETESGQYAENELYVPYAIIQWREADGAEAYIVEEWDGSNWISRSEVIDASVGYYKYQTDPLSDSTSHLFRVKAVDINDNAGTPVNFTFTPVRNPAPPEVSIDLESNDLVVSEG